MPVLFPAVSSGARIDFGTWHALSKYWLTKIPQPVTAGEATEGALPAQRESTWT